MKKLITLALFALTFGFFMTSCGDDDEKNPATIETCTDGIQNQDETGIDCGGVCKACSQADESRTGSITADETWTNDRIWVLNQKVVVKDGVTLTIEPGTIIKGSKGEGTLASALVIERGGKIMAEGTAEQPIIFTSVLDNVEVGQTAGTNLTVNDIGLWGGLIVLGKAPCSFDGGVEELQIEGIPEADTFGLYGGTVAADNSGKLAYISIRHGGALIGADNEINGLTLGGVGNGTSINHIEVVSNADDGVEFFGGTVNASELLVWAQGDDGLDIDQAYSGTISNSMVVLGIESDHALEIDGPEGPAAGKFTLDGITLVGFPEAEDGEYADYRKAATGTTKNVFAYNFKEGHSDVELDNAGVAQEYINGNLVFEAWQIVLPGADTIGDIFKEKTEPEEISSFEADALEFAKGVEMGKQTVGADVAQFDWTYAKAQSAF